MNVSVERGLPHVELTVSGVPAKGSVSAFWRLPGGQREPAEPHELSNGRHSIVLLWVGPELLVRSLVIDVWSPLAPPEPPAIAVADGSLEPMLASLNKSTYEMRIDLEVSRQAAFIDELLE